MGGILFGMLDGSVELKRSSTCNQVDMQGHPLPLSTTVCGNALFFSQDELFEINTQILSFGKRAHKDARTTRCTY